MAICQWAPPAADENTIPWLLAKTPPLPPRLLGQASTSVETPPPGPQSTARPAAVGEAATAFAGPPPVGAHPLSTLPATFCSNVMRPVQGARLLRRPLPLLLQWRLPPRGSA